VCCIPLGCISASKSWKRTSTGKIRRREDIKNKKKDERKQTEEKKQQKKKETCIIHEATVPKNVATSG
jgi:hypothetical protein